MKLTSLEQKIADIIAPVVKDLGFSLVYVNMQNEILQIMAENPQTRRLSIDDCTKISREIAAILDVEDPIQGAYKLEVSSPGIDRPLVNMQDFADFKGFEVKLEVSPPLEGQKRFRGYLEGTENEDILVKTDTGVVALPFISIQKAKLVLTDELIKATGTKN